MNSICTSLSVIAGEDYDLHPMTDNQTIGIGMLFDSLPLIIFPQTDS